MSLSEPLSVLDQWLVRRMGWPGVAAGSEASAVPTPAQLRDWQLRWLREMIAHAKAHSPFYARHLAAIQPQDIATPGDFAALPMLTPRQLRETPEQLLCVSQDEIARVVTLASSGTTGTPKRIFHTEADLEATVDYFGWGMSNLVGPGQTAFVLLPGDRPGGVGQLLMDALGRTGARAVAHGVLENVHLALAQCLADEARCIVGSPAHVNLLAHAFADAGLPKGTIKTVLLCWDAVPRAVVENVTRLLGCQVFRHWGMIETGLGGAVECAPGSGMHLRETDVFMEIVDPDSGEPLPDGEVGEMIVSTPLRHGMPLLRYRTGDLGRILPGRCRCGSPLRRLDPLVLRRNTGRSGPASDLPTLQELSEVLYALPGLSDFAVRLDGHALRITVCGGDGLEKDVRAALAAMPGLAGLTLDIIRKNDGSPAIPGLGKRRIEIGQEN